MSASVRARLLQLARDRGEDFQFLLTRYANERLLFRLASSMHSGSFVLKGATLFTVWHGSPHRATRDIDLLTFGDPSVAAIRAVFVEILSLSVPDDGIRFDLDTLKAGPIREDKEYGGVRIELVAYVEKARIRLQVDVGVGDAIIPPAQVIEFPTLLLFPAPILRAYPRETVVAEKFEAMVQLGMANSRMKDFYDISVLARDFDFDGELLVRAIRATFKRRNTPLPAAAPVALTNAFADDAMKVAQWAGFVRKSGMQDAGNLGDAVTAIRAFLLDPLKAIADGSSSPGVWLAGQGWS